MMIDGLSIVNPNPSRLQGPELLHHLVVQTSSSDVAIEHTSENGRRESVSYGELHNRSDRLASILRNPTKASSQSSRQNFIVPLFVPQSLDLYTAQIAILKAGGAFCPIPLDVPEERLRFILQDINASVLLTVSSLASRLPSLEHVEIIQLDKVAASPDATAEASTVCVTPDQAAYVMYTSGSTGTPKGVVLSHSAATQALLAHDRHIPKFSRFLQFANPTFDVSVFEIFFPLFRGATLVSCDRRKLLNDLPGVINALNVDAAELTPSVANSLLHDRNSVPSLKLLLTIGEMLKKSVVEEFAGDSTQPGILYGMYGPTEATIHCTLQPAFTKDMAVNDIGIPLDTVSAFIVSPATEPNAGDSPEILPLGEEGELAVGGYQLADGYLNRPEQTKAAFVQHVDYGRLYRTGDRARLTAAGTFECLGRMSSGQVKLRGQRIELGEIEYAAAQTPGCKAVVADVLDSTLVAFCVCADATTTPADVRKTCGRWLPTYMVPGDVVILDALPYLASAKVDRKALAEQYAIVKRPPSTGDHGSHLCSDQILQTFNDVLKAPIGPETLLTSVGLDSLSAIRIAAQLRRNGYPSVDANTLLEARSPADLEKLIDRENDESSDPSQVNGEQLNAQQLFDAASLHPLIASRRDELEQVYYSTPLQSAMLAQTEIDPKSYCNWVLLEAKGITDVTMAQRVIESVCTLHPLLRSGALRVEEAGPAPLMLTWKTLTQSRVRVVQELDYDFQIRDDTEALNLSSFDILPTCDGIRILMKLHHALYDQWSVDVLKSDLTTLLANDSISQRPHFDAVANFYANDLANARTTEALDFWQEHLREFSPTTVPNLSGRVVSKQLQRTSWSEMRFDTVQARRQASQLGYSLPSVFQSALSWLLATYSGNTDVTFGTVFSGRHIPVPDIEYLFGPCLCTLPSRIDISAVRTCMDLIRLTHNQNRTMQRHALTPLADIKRVSRCAPDTPLFDALFVWQESTISDSIDQATVVELDAADNHEFNLVLEVQPSTSGVQIRATYQQALIPEQQVQLLLKQFECIVETIMQQPDHPVSSLDMSLKSDLMSISNPDVVPSAPGNDMVKAIERQAKERPESTALAFASSINDRGAEITSLTYSEFNSRANSIAHFLRSQGVRPNDLVCICMEKSTDLYASILAVVKVGAGYLPLTPETPSARVHNILRQAHVKACLCDGHSIEMLQGAGDCLVVQVDQLNLKQYSNNDLAIKTTGAEVAYTVFTSGSTGEPKGVVVTRDNLSGNLAVLAKLYSVSSGDRLLQACSQGFDVSVFEIFFALTNGMVLCSAVKETLFHDFEQSIRAFGITHLSLTPTVASLVDPANVPSVQFLVTAGEGVTEVVRRKWAGRGLHQGYGPSETTNICTINMNMRASDVLGNIGPPFSNTSAFVIAADAPDFKLLPAGAVGEFAFGGEQVFRGYLGRNDLNRAKLIDHPQFGLVYRSGDVGRILHDGSLLTVGRLDDQVKIRGNRVELGEIAAALLQDPNVIDCSVLVEGQDSFGRTLVAFWVPKTSMEEKATEVATIDSQHIGVLFEQLESKLPSYMVPDALIPVTKMPHTSQGKLDKRLLQQLLADLGQDKMAFSRHASQVDDDDELSPIEIEVRAALASTLRIPQEQIRKSTSFFALGLNSLSAIAFAKAIEARIKRTVNIGSVLKHPSIARLVASLPSSGPNGTTIESSKLTPFSSDFLSRVKAECETMGTVAEAILPCTPLQEALLSASDKPGSTTYCNTTVFRVGGDIGKLQQCWNSLMRRHAILRTHFVTTDDATHPYAQVAVKGKEIPWRTIDMPRNGGSAHSYPPPAGFGHAAPFFVDACSSTTTTTLVLHLHHAIYDGISMSVLLDEAQQLYNGQDLPAVAHFEAFLAECEVQRSPSLLDFWRDRLHNYLPKPFPHDAKTAEQHECVVERVFPSSDAALQSFCKKQSVTPLSVFQAAWAKTLSCVQGASDICFGNVVSGRSVDVPDVDRLVAPCFNTIPVRVDLTQCSSNDRLIRQLQDWNIDTVNHQLAPLRRLQAASRAPHQHLFDSMLLLQPPSTPLDSSIWEIVAEEGTMDIALVLELVPNGDTFTALLHHTQPQIAQDLATSLLEAFAAALNDVLQYPSGTTDAFEAFDRASIAGKLEPDQDLTADSEPLQSETDAGADWNEAESTVRQVFADLSKVNLTRIQKQTSMYQLGLDSLNAAQIAARLRSKGLSLDATDVMERQTPYAIAARTANANETQSKEDSALDLDAFDNRHRGHVLQSLALDDTVLQAVRPCTAVQCGMIAQSMHSNGKLYINHITHEIPDGVSTAAVQRAWGAVQAKHPMLRTRFCKTDDPENPFLMAMLRPDEVTLPYTIQLDAVQLATVETQLSKEISQSLDHTAWRITIFQGDDRTLMMLSIHHACYDAESLRFLLDDFALALAEQPLQPARGIDTLLTAALGGRGSDKDASSTFWKDAIENTNFVKFPDLWPTTDGAVGMQVSEHVCDLSLTTIEKYCRDNGATIQAVGQAAWASLLSAYTGEAKVTFGTVFSGRSGSENEKTAFPSISTIPVPCSTSSTSQEMVHSMVDYNAAAYRHRFTPLADIQRYAGDASTSLFDTVFVYQKISSNSESARFNWSLVKETASVDYAVSLEMEVLPDATVLLRVTCDASRVPQSHGSLLAQQYEHLLTQITIERRTTPADLTDLYSLVPAKEPELPASARYLHDFVAEGAVKHPEKPALHFVRAMGKNQMTTWTYRELNERGNQVAHLLRQRGVRSGSIVAVRMDKSAEASFAFIGILKAGCSFLALDPGLPEARQSFILEDSGASILLVNGDHHDDSQRPKGCPTLALQDAMLSGLPSEPVDSGLSDPYATCYCLYTSGTTGTPKGCELTHENAVQAMLAFQRLFAGHWDANSRWLQFASYWFDVSVLEQFWSWSVGIAVVGAPRDLVLEDLAGFIQHLHITHIDLTPSLARLLHPDDVPSLHNGVFITGGEALKQEIIDAWGPIGAICNGYGPTEATIGVTMNPFVGTNAKPSNIGPAFDNVGAYVLVPGTDEPVLRGAVGELCVSGKLVGKGYLNRPELTAKSFPYLERFGEKVYRTGDLVRLLADGSFSFIGRKDTQAKLRGQRLEIGEIDAVIHGSSSQVTEVASLVVKDESGSKEQLVSFLTSGVARNSAGLTVEDSDKGRELASAADQACREKLPGYMVPTHIVPVNFFPLTVNNKVDSKSLVALFRSLSIEVLQQLKGNTSRGGELNEHERKICQVLGDMLEIPRDSIDSGTNVFTLGLSSISAITFASLLKKAGFANAHVAIVMQNATIARLASALSKSKPGFEQHDNLVKQAQLSISAFAQRHRTRIIQRLAVRAQDIEAITPCTALQEGLILESLRKSDRPYFNEFRYKLENVDLFSLQHAFDLVTRNVQLLRSRYLETDDGFAQVVLKEARVSWTVLPTEGDIERALLGRRERWLKNSQEELFQPIQVIMSSSPGQSWLVIHVHHCLYDGVSWQLLLERIAQAYPSKQIPDCGPRFTEALPYGPLCSRKDAKAFWQKRLDDFQYVPLPRDRSSIESATVTASMRLSSTATIESGRKALGVSHQACMQACLEVALQRCLPSTRSYGQVVSGRSIGMEGADQVIGPLFNTLPHSINVNSGDTWRQLICRTNEDNVVALPYQHTSLREIVKWCGMRPSDPLFDVLFVFQHQGESSETKANQLFREIEQPPRADYPLAFEVTLRADGGLEVLAVAESLAIDQASVEALLASFHEALLTASTKPDATVSEKFALEVTATPPQERPVAKEAPQLNGVHGFEWSNQAQSLRDAIAQVAGVDAGAIDEHSTLFAIGLDSIDAVKLVSRVKKLGMNIPVSKILQAQTIPRMLAAVQDATGPVTNGHTATRLHDSEQRLTASLRSELRHGGDGVERIVPATPSQEGLVADMIRSEWQDYYNHDILRLSPDIDLDRIKAAWQMVVDKTPILRTSFVQVNDPELDITFAQIVFPRSQLAFREIVVEDEDALQSELSCITQEVKSNYQSRPLLRLTLANVASKRYLVLSLSHAQYDGHSLTLIHEDVQRAYGGTVPERPSYDLSIEDSLTATNAEARGFWSNAMSGAKRNSLQSPNNNDSTSAIYRAEKKSMITSQAARSFCQQHGISQQALAQTCWAILLAHHTRSLEIIFGVVLACRDSEEAEQVVFPTMNTVPVRAALHGTRSDMLRYMQDMINEMRPFQRTPLRTIQSLSAQNSQGSDSGSLFDTLFLYQHRPEGTADEHAPLYESVGGSSSIEYPVAVEMETLEDMLVLRTACKASAFDETGTQRLLDQLDQVLRTVITSPDEPTVSFDRDTVSICGLPSITINSDSGNGESSNSVTETNGVAHDDGEHSSLAISIRDALAQVAKIPSDSISPSATIESIGVDSISAIKVSALLRKQSISVSVSEIIKGKTFVQMARIAAAKTKHVAPPAKPPAQIIHEVLQQRGLDTVPEGSDIDPNNVEGILPATAGQIYMLNVWQNSAGRLFYPTFKYRLAGNHGMDAIRRAWKKVVARHAILRTLFCATGDSEVPVLQVVLKDAGARFYKDQREEAVGLRQPMVSLRAQQQEDDFLLSLKIHHALYDAVSLPLLLQDFQASLFGHSLQSLTTKQEDFLALSLLPERRTAAKQFWTSYLQNCDPVRLPQPAATDHRRVELFRPSLLSPKTTTALEHLARTENLTFQSLLFATYAKLYSGIASSSMPTTTSRRTDDVVLGIYLANRSSHPDLTAPTLNLVPLRVPGAGSKNILGLARDIKKDLGRIMEADATGLWEIADWTGVKVDTFVNFLRVGDNDHEENEGGEVLGEVDEGYRTMEYSRVVESEGASGGVAGLKELEKMDGSAYLHSVDLEITVREGKVDMGLFCPENMLGLEQAQDTVEGLKKELKGLVFGNTA